jgi:small subunit ribosomal protein S4
MYGLSENQFRLLFARADRQKGVTGTNLLIALERRLDNVVYRMGFTNSRTQGRHLVRHRHFLVNGRRVNIPSYPIKIGDVVEVQEKSREMVAIQGAIEAVARRGVPQWMELDKEKKRGVIKSLPVREDLTMPIQEQLIVELYSK